VPEINMGMRQYGASPGMRTKTRSFIHLKVLSLIIIHFYILRELG
jgi:hypothetical protein